MKRNKGMQLSAVLAVMLIVSIAFVPTVSAKSTEKNEKIQGVIQLDPYTYVLDKEVPNDEKSIAKIESKLDKKHNVAIEEITSGNVTSQGEYSGSDRYTKDVLGSYIEGNTYFHGVTSSGVKATFVGDGSLRAEWHGDESDIDRITLGSQIVITGVLVTVTVPPSVGFTVNGNTATYSGSWDDEAWVTHYFENVKGESWTILYDYDVYDSETFRFGNEDHTIYTHVDL